MDDWEDESFEPPAAIKLKPAAAKASWEDEDAESEEDEEALAASVAKVEVAPKQPLPGGAKSKKKELEDKIKQRELEQAERNRQKALEQERMLAGLSPAERKKKIEELEREADLENAKDLFMDAAPQDASAEAVNDPEDPDSLTLDSIVLKGASSKVDEKFVELLVAKLQTVYNARKPERYLDLVKMIIRESSAELEVDDFKEIVNTCNVISNEKLKAKAAAQGKKKKVVKKVSVKMDRDDEPMPARGALATDYDDFM